MNKEDLSFKTENGRLNYRVGAIIISNNKVLMVKNSIASYYYSVGGRVKLNESSEEAIVREVYEETGFNFEIDRLGFIHENFFIEEITKEVFHEISLFYYMKTDKNPELICNSFTENGIKENLIWIPIDNLENKHLFPEFFKNKLKNPSTIIEHIISKDY